MIRFLRGFLLIAGLSFVAIPSLFPQQPAEPPRLQKSVAEARPIRPAPVKPAVVNPATFHAASPAEPTVDVPIHQVGKQFRLLGKLGLPLGEVTRVQGIVINDLAKSYEAGLNVRVFRINGVATQAFVQIKLSDYYGRDEVPVQPGAAFELEGFETGGFVGLPAEAVKRGGAVAQGAGPQTAAHHFVHEFVVIQASEIKLQPFTPADFLGRDMLIQGQAVSEGGSAYIAGNGSAPGNTGYSRQNTGWKLLVDNGTPWPRTTEGRTVEARGVIRTLGKSTTYRLENGGKANNARLVNLADQIGKQVSLRGTLSVKNEEYAFRYRGQLVQVEGLKNLVAQAGPLQEAQVTGTLEVLGGQYVVRKASLKPTDTLLAIERAEAVE